MADIVRRSQRIKGRLEAAEAAKQSFLPPSPSAPGHASFSGIQNAYNDDPEDGDEDEDEMDANPQDELRASMVVAEAEAESEAWFAQRRESLKSNAVFSRINGRPCLFRHKKKMSVIQVALKREEQDKKLFQKRLVRIEEIRKAQTRILKERLAMERKVLEIPDPHVIEGPKKGVKMADDGIPPVPDSPRTPRGVQLHGQFGMASDSEDEDSSDDDPLTIHQPFQRVGASNLPAPSVEAAAVGRGRGGPKAKAKATAQNNFQKSQAKAKVAPVPAPKATAGRRGRPPAGGPAVGFGSIAASQATAPAFVTPVGQPWTPSAPPSGKKVIEFVGAPVGKGRKIPSGMFPWQHDMVTTRARGRKGTKAFI